MEEQEILDLPLIGQEVPDFEFEVYHKGKISKTKLSDYKNKWIVMLFYPADFTFVCPTELTQAAELYKKFQDAGAEVISVSTDTAFVHKAWHDQSPMIKKIKYPMAADPTGVICNTLGTYLPEEGLSTRATFILNPKREIVAADFHSNDIGRNSEETLRKLQAAKFVSENKGMVCPASWKPGAKTLKPSEKLIGKL